MQPPVQRVSLLCDLKTKYEISPLDGVQQRFKNAKIIHAMGYASGPPVYARVLPSPYDADSLKQAALKAASEADLVLFFGGLNKKTTSVARDTCFMKWN